MKIVIFGSSGFIGKNFVQFLTQRDHTVFGVDIFNNKSSNSNFTHITADIRNMSFESIKAIEKFNTDLYINLAAVTDIVGNNLNHYNSNFDLDNKLLDLIKLQKIKFIHFSTQLVHSYGTNINDSINADTFYGSSKILSEHIIKNEIPNSIILRPTSVWGPAMGLPYRGFINLAKKGVIINSKSFNVLKSFVYVTSLINQTMSFSSSLEPQSTAYLTDDPISLENWINTVAKEYKAKVIYLPYWMLYLLSKIGNIIYFIPFNSRRLKNMTTESNIKNQSSVPTNLLISDLKTFRANDF